jgi:hypothetical protein
MKLIVKKISKAKAFKGHKPTSMYVVQLSINELIGALKVKRTVFSHSDSKLKVGSVALDCKRIVTWRSPEGFDWLQGAE